MPDGSGARAGSVAFLGSPTAPAGGVLVHWTLRADSTPSMSPAIFRGGSLVAQDPTLMAAADRTVSLPIRVGDQLGLRAPGGTFPQAFDGATLLVTGVIEPDADNDGYGDETQDACPAEASLHVAPCHADIALTMTGPAFGVVDRDTPYDVTVANRGPSAAAGVIVTDVIPSGGRFVRSEGAGTCTSGATLRCTLAAIAPGASGVLTIVLAGNAEGTSFHHAVSVTTTSIDPTPGDHSAAVDTLVTGASVAPPPLALGCAACANATFGGRDDDVLLGTSFGDRMYGRQGRDLLRGRAGDDCLFGGEGADVLDGDGGDDTVSGGDGRDRLFGGAGKDRLLGAAKGDELHGDSGDDQLFPGTGRDRVWAAPATTSSRHATARAT